MKKNYFFIFISFLLTQAIFAQEQYIGEIRMFASSRTPIGWFNCDGRILSIAQYETLFNLIGTTYGGDGTTTFALPDLRGKVPVGQGRSSQSGITRVVGTSYGQQTTTITSSNLPPHAHQYQIKVNSGEAKTNVPTTVSSMAISGFNSGKITVPNLGYTTSTNNLIDNTAIVKIQPAGQSIPISIVKPMCVINYIICYQGIFPSTN